MWAAYSQNQKGTFPGAAPNKKVIILFLVQAEEQFQIDVRQTSIPNLGNWREFNKGTAWNHVLKQWG